MYLVGVGLLNSVSLLFGSDIRGDEALFQSADCLGDIFPRVETLGYYEIPFQGICLLKKGNLICADLLSSGLHAYGLIMSRTGKMANGGL